MELALLAMCLGALVADNAQSDNKRFEGTWTMLSGEENGTPVPESLLKKSRLVVKDDKYTVTLGAETWTATHKLDLTKNPKTMDVINDDGSRIDALYELTDDTFKVCLIGPGKPRPKEFTAKAGSGQIIHVWKRVKN